ncbi:MAG: hypothetical protein SGJ16_06885, partial [Nitrospirota bacterium]|nr:hypothetical protein [Nitrospirota bacterium]
VSATRPRDSYLCTDQRVGVKELERWPNNWGQVILAVSFKARIFIGTKRYLTARPVRGLPRNSTLYEIGVLSVAR